jgi:DNA-binding NarL/FixJ family response regulator
MLGRKIPRRRGRPRPSGYHGRTWRVAGDRENPAALTTRELEVVRLLATGLRNAEIAERLYLSTRTVDHHVAAVLRKLGAATRVEAATAALRLGLLENP